MLVARPPLFVMFARVRLPARGTPVRRRTAGVEDQDGTVGGTEAAVGGKQGLDGGNRGWRGEHARRTGREPCMQRTERRGRRDVPPAPFDFLENPHARPPS